jgi:hypothetical protein
VGVFNGPDRPRRVCKFLDVLGKLDYLVALGINAILLLPIVEVASGRSLGYEGFDIFSPEMDYGAEPGPELRGYLGLVNGLRGRFDLPALKEDQLTAPGSQLKAVIELFHLHGVAVLLDVVYNHAGGQMKGQQESLWFFDRAAGTANNDSLYFTDQDHAGPVWAIWKREVRQFLIDNSTFFLQEYHLDSHRRNRNWEEALACELHSAGNWQSGYSPFDSNSFRNHNLQGFLLARQCLETMRGVHLLPPINRRLETTGLGGAHYHNEDGDHDLFRERAMTPVRKGIQP